MAWKLKITDDFAHKGEPHWIEVELIDEHPPQFPIAVFKDGDGQCGEVATDVVRSDWAYGFRDHDAIIGEKIALFEQKFRGLF